MIIVDKKRIKWISWLYKLGLVLYLAGLSDIEIKSLYQIL